MFYPQVIEITRAGGRELSLVDRRPVVPQTRTAGRGVGGPVKSFHDHRPDGRRG